MLLVVFGALLCGLGEFATRILVFRWSPYLDWVFQLNPQAVWMGPIAALPAVLVATGIAWLVAGQSTRDTVRYGLPLGTVLFLAVFQAGLTTARVHVAALAVLALGLAVHLTRWSIAHRVATTRLVRWSTVVLAFISIGGGLGLNAVRVGRERLAYRALPAAPDTPNVLVLILDTVRAQELSAYGYSRPTSPFLATFAADGIRFDRALATAPWTLPSHASFLTGLYPHQLDVGWTRGLDDSYRTLADAFSEYGFATAGFVANPYYGTWRHGLGQGFHHYSDYALSVGEVFANSNLNRRTVRLWNDLTGGFWRPGERNASSINDDILGWLDRRPPERPFFVFANYIDAHTPYAPPDDYRWRYAVSKTPARRPHRGRTEEPPSPERTQSLRDAYDGSITYLDAQLAVLFRELDKRGFTSNTIILISSDHGEQFGEHGFLEHGASLYLHELHVPLMIHLPNGAHRGCVVRDWVTLRDIPATLTDAAGLELDPPFPGHSLVRRCSGNTPENASPLLAETVGRPHLPGWYPASEGDIQGLIFGNMHYTRRGSGAERLFDTSVDSMEMHDLSGDPAHAASLKTARRLLSTSRR